jgi:hypothetical protein
MLATDTLLHHSSGVTVQVVRIRDCGAHQLSTG